MAAKATLLIGCEVADAGEPWASSGLALAHCHFIYRTAVEAFAPDEVRVQLCILHGYPVREIGLITCV